MVSCICALLVFLLFSFPNYCDRCSYRDITLSAADAATKSLTVASPCPHPSTENGNQPACGSPGVVEPAGALDDEADGNTGSDTGVRHVRVPYCLSYTVSSIAGSGDLPDAARGSLESAPLRVVDPAFARLALVLDHKESRAPPA